MKGVLSTPLFSIVTICLNDLENLKKTVSSVKAQNFDDYEYIVVDGGSADGSAEYLKHVSLDRFISEPDDGIFFAMNKALAMCNGNYISFMNAGDVFYDKYVLSRVAKEIKKHPDIPFFYGDVVLPTYLRYYARQPSRLTNIILYRSTGVCHQAWFLSSKIYSEVGGFDVSFVYKGDRDLLTKIIIEKKVSYKHFPSVIAKYKGDGFGEINKKAGEQEIKIIRKKYFSSKQITYLSIGVRLIDIVKKLPFYENIMLVCNKIALFYFVKRKGEG